jgi:hypothetical protein
MLVIGSLGLVGNFCTILKIWRDKKFHTSTFVTIGCLAFADFLSIMNCFVLYFTNIPSAVYVRHAGVPSAVIFSIASELVYLSSLGHMMLLFLIRYLVTVHPLQSRRYLVTVHPLQSRSHLTSLVVILWSVTVWILSLILSVFETSYGIVFLLFSQRENGKQFMGFYSWGKSIASLIHALFPLCTILTLHYLKMKSLRSSRVSKKATTKMNLIITVILGVFLSFQVLFIVTSVLRLLIYYEIIRSTIFMFRLKTHLSDARILLGYVHWSCNPYIYFFYFLLS